MNVYWAPLLPPREFFSSARFYEPTHVGIEFKKNSPQELSNNYAKCPAFGSVTKNLYSLKFPFSYNVSFADDIISSDDHDQDFFNNMLDIRNFEHRIVSINLSYIFIAEDQDLVMQFLPAFLSDNDFVNKTTMIPGEYNIGKWTRPMDCAFKLKNNVQRLSITEGDDYGYVKFLTDKKINFERFYPTDEFQSVLKDILNIRTYRSKTLNSLYHYYRKLEQSKYKNYLLKIIKNNLVVDNNK